MELATFLSLVKASTDLAKASKQISSESPEDLHAKITHHIKTIEVWSSRIQTLGMLVPLSTTDATIPLLMNSTPRTFTINNLTPNLSEADILADSNNYIVLGDPGSGKTTTVKRLVRKVLYEAPSSQNDKVNFPVRIIARELERGHSLYRAIADIRYFALDYDMKFTWCSAEGEMIEGPLPF
ncbi:hypothetical protein [Sphingomonas bacterium]|uniref:hypothetical protein n=1 Tax=Sphingomonas bacterium TaxID=1895847 RepID=UPI00260BC3BB|nr:hypothetical protein [Sphingomonas bacterium]MDB5678438.1 hypothetical protein [Sphingomonas bacterium]